MLFWSFLRIFVGKWGLIKPSFKIESLADMMLLHGFS